MRTVCAWCSIVMREGPPPISHGCCQTCQVALLAEPVPAVEQRIEEAQRRQ